ncbi:MAG: TonB-dependent receptor [Chitinophagaceae bacterium]|nr:TonB-dependent receptor [Chitinophagaceae bacterium]MCW5925783.1 TonB-dependent receptor [Chitinophagaceae bacterium]
MKIVKFFILLLSIHPAMGQQDNDSVPSLSEVIIKGYESGRRLLETPVAVGVVGQRDMQRFSPVSLVPALNVVPGVRMEERSPGSYRLSIRGSLLRSPFGVRNVKIYWNDIPFTDAGGNTYFNLLDQSGIQQVEILKGPGGSLYGANTGGVVLLHTNELPLQEDPSHQTKLQLTAGSYGLFGENAQWKYRNKAFSSSLTQSHLQSGGYRDNTRMRRDVLQWNGTARLNAKNELNWIMLYADMFYQTPGGLTQQQMEENPRQARPGMQDLKVAIYNKTILTGISNEYRLNDKWSNVTSMMFSYTDFRNPFLMNFETRAESNTGLRSKMVYQENWGRHSIKLAAGAEWTFNYSVINNYGNRQGVQDTIQYKDRISASQIYPFLQAEWWLDNRFQLQAGTSGNFYRFTYRRPTDTDDSRKAKSLKEQLLPRVAALYRISNRLSVYSSISKGFSPPTVAEIRPSEGSIHSNLQAEYGWNTEVGVKGNAFNGRWQFDITAFEFKLRDAIVVRRTNAGADYFVNAGNTSQKGLEVYTDYQALRRATGFISDLKIWSSAAVNNFRFKSYMVENAQGMHDYSGNRLTGVANEVVSAGVDINTRPGIYLNTSFCYTAGIPLNDANTAYAAAYRLLNGRIGWNKKLKKVSLNIFTGIDNGLNQLYSLGNDLNAFGNRFFNPAQARNYYGGVMLGL